MRGLPLIADPIDVYQGARKSGSWVFASLTQRNPESVTTSIAAGSNGQSLPQSTIALTSTVGITPPAPNGFGTVGILIGSVVVPVTFTGISGNSLTGCAGGTGTLLTGQVVTTYPYSYFQLPTGTTLLTMQVRQLLDPNSTLLLSLDNAGEGGLSLAYGSIFNGPPTPSIPNSIAYALTSAQTLALPQGIAYYDIFVNMNSAPDSDIYVSGTFNVHNTNTRNV